MISSVVSVAILELSAYQPPVMEDIELNINHDLVEPETVGF